MFKIFACIFIYFLNFGAFGNPQNQKDPSSRIQLIDIFDLEYVTEPKISPDASLIVYTRNFMDIASDQRLSNIWATNIEGSKHWPLTSGNNNNFSPTWSPAGDRLLYASTASGQGVELFSIWMETGYSAKLSNLPHTPSNFSWSPDGNWIAFTMFVPKKSASLVSLPNRPSGSDWADPPQEIDDVMYKLDGAGYLESGNYQLFVIPSDGGSPIQLTSEPYDHQGNLVWTPNSNAIIFSANRDEDSKYDLPDTEVYKLNISDKSITQLTDRQGPDNSPTISPDGKQIAYVGFDDNYVGYQNTHLYITNIDGSDSRVLVENFDRSITNPKWNKSGDKIFFQYEEYGDTKVAYTDLSGNVKSLTSNLGGNIGLPYTGGSYSLSSNDIVAFTYSKPDVVSEVGIIQNQEEKILTSLNRDFLKYKSLGSVEEFWYESGFDGRKIQGWLIKPPNFDETKKYPLILNIHGGPHLSYGSSFSIELQLKAAAGYVVLYTNPRGSTGYGEEFAQEIQNDFPGNDYKDLMSGVDVVLQNEFIDENRLYITGGSGGGTLTAWAISQTNRFKAAVVEKPVINWYSFALTSDFIPYYHKYWLPGYPWENEDHYMKRSPISYVANVTTPTMILSGDADYRVPISQAEQYYAALKLRKIETIMVRIPGASHYVSLRPSQMMAKVAYITKWFDTH